MIFLFSASLAWATAEPEILVVQGGRIWDGTGSPTAVRDILVHDGTIKAIDIDIDPPEDARVIDAHGYTIIPGLIDSHVHLASVPGAWQREETDQEMDVWRRIQLRSYLAHGVTAVLDAGIPATDLERVQNWLDEGVPAPEVYTLGPPFSPPDGYAQVLVPHLPTVASPAEAEAQFDQLVDAGAMGAKVFVEEGFATRIWPLHSPEMRSVIAKAAAERNLPIFVHAMSPREYELALEMNPYAFVHPPTKTPPELVQRLAEEEIWVTTTLSIADMFLVLHEPERLEISLVRLSVPRTLRESALDPVYRRMYQDLIVDTMTPSAPSFLRPVIRNTTDAEGLVRRRLQHLQETVATLHAAGVPVVLGSDAGNWPALITSFHGPSTAWEWMRLSEAIGNEAALIAATRLPAEMLGVADERGTLEVGKQADFVILAENPLENPAAIWTVAWTVRKGEARTPSGWMTDALDPSG